jgi:hypothetical protein
MSSRLTLAAILLVLALLYVVWVSRAPTAARTAPAGASAAAAGPDSVAPVPSPDPAFLHKVMLTVEACRAAPAQCPVPNGFAGQAEATPATARALRAVDVTPEPMADKLRVMGRDIPLPPDLYVAASGVMDCLVGRPCLTGGIYMIRSRDKPNAELEVSAETGKYVEQLSPGDEGVFDMLKPSLQGPLPLPTKAGAQ